MWLLKAVALELYAAGKSTQRLQHRLLDTLFLSRGTCHVGSATAP